MFSRVKNSKCMPGNAYLAHLLLSWLQPCAQKARLNWIWGSGEGRLLIELGIKLKSSIHVWANDQWDSLCKGKGVGWKLRKPSECPWDLSCEARGQLSREKQRSKRDCVFMCDRERERKKDCLVLVLLNFLVPYPGSCTFIIILHFSDYPHYSLPIATIRGREEKQHGPSKANLFPSCWRTESSRTISNVEVWIFLPRPALFKTSPALGGAKCDTNPVFSTLSHLPLSNYQLFRPQDYPIKAELDLQPAPKLLAL